MCSATKSFTSGDIGERFVIKAGSASGWTYGSYTINGVDGDCAVLDRACGPNGALSNGGWFYGGKTISNVTIKDCIVRNCEHEGIAIYQAWGSPTNKTDTVLVTGCKMYNNNLGLLIANESLNVTAEENEIYDNVKGAFVRVTFEVFDSYYPYGPTNFTFRNNMVRRNTSYGMYVFSPSIYISGSIYSNIFYDNGYTLNTPADGYELSLFGYAGYTWSTSEVNVYNNTIVSINNPNNNQSSSFAVGTGVSSAADFADATVRFFNNIVYVGSSITSANYRPIWDRWSSIQASEHGYNLIHRANSDTANHVVTSSGSYDRDGTASDLTNWEATALKVDPELLNAGGSYALASDFAINSSSPAYGAGTWITGFHTPGASPYYNKFFVDPSSVDIGAMGVMKHGLQGSGFTIGR